MPSLHSNGPLSICVPVIDSNSSIPSSYSKDSSISSESTLCWLLGTFRLRKRCRQFSTFLFFEGVGCSFLPVKYALLHSLILSSLKWFGCLRSMEKARKTRIGHKGHWRHYSLRSPRFFRLIVCFHSFVQFDWLWKNQTYEWERKQSRLSDTLMLGENEQNQGWIRRGREEVNSGSRGIP